jgi:hypothetical protein
MGFRHLAVGLFADEEMMMAAAGNLRQVSAHDLGGFAQLTQQFADHGGRRAADADIHSSKISAGVSIFRAVMT